MPDALYWYCPSCDEQFTIEGRDRKARRRLRALKRKHEHGEGAPRRRRTGWLALVQQHEKR